MSPMRDVRTYGRTREDRATQPMDAGWLSFAILHTHMIKVNDPPHQVLDDKIFICHVGLPIHSEGSILVKNGSKALAKVEVKWL